MVCITLSTVFIVLVCFFFMYQDQYSSTLGLDYGCISTLYNIWIVYFFNIHSILYWIDCIQNAWFVWLEYCIFIVCVPHLKCRVWVASLVDLFFVLLPYFSSFQAPNTLFLYNISFLECWSVMIRNIDILWKSILPYSYLCLILVNAYAVEMYIQSMCLCVCISLCVIVCVCVCVFKIL